jgi:hypothetical protein
VFYRRAPKCRRVAVRRLRHPAPPFLRLVRLQEDAAGFFAIKKATAKLAQHAVINDGQDLADTVLCLNYTLGDTALESLYGGNVPILKSLRNNYDRTGLARAVTNICQPFRV